MAADQVADRLRDVLPGRAGVIDVADRGAGQVVLTFDDGTRAVLAITVDDG